MYFEILPDFIFILEVVVVISFINIYIYRLAHSPAIHANTSLETRGKKGDIMWKSNAM